MSFHIFFERIPCSGIDHSFLSAVMYSYASVMGIILPKTPVKTFLYHDVKKVAEIVGDVFL